MINPIIKVIELFVDEEHDAILESISIVDKPAIEREFMYFSEDGRKMLYFQEEADQRIVVSPAMIPDKMIARKDDDTGEIYYVYFSAESIAKAAEYLMKYNKQSHSNVNHQRIYSNDMYVMESWIKESDNDKSTDYGFGDLPKGTWFVKFRILNDDVWKKIKTGELKGLSVEGDFLLGAEKYMTAKFGRHKLKYSVVRSKYKRVYKGLSEEEKDKMDQILFLVEMAAKDVYDNPAEAVKRSKALGLNGEIHSFMDPETKTLMYMPGANMESYEKAQMQVNPPDVVSLDVPMLQRMLEVSREDSLTDVDLHKIVENATAMAAEGKILTIEDYPAIVGQVSDSEMEIAADLPYYVDQGQGMKKKKTGTPLSEMEFSENIQFESYSDYPESAKNAAQRALDWAEKNGWGSCGTPVGKARANQLAKGEPISEETISRMASFARHLQHKDVPYSEGCGGLMVDAWGGQAGIEWAQNKLEKIRKQRVENTSDIISQAPGAGLGFADPADLKVGDAVSWQTSGSNPRGKIREIVREGSKKVPGADFEIAGTSDDPGYIIELYEEDAEGNWKPTGTMVGRKADSILKNVDFVESQIDIQNSKFRIFLSPLERRTVNRFINDVKTTYGL